MSSRNTRFLFQFYSYGKVCSRVGEFNRGDFLAFAGTSIGGSQLTGTPLGRARRSMTSSVSTLPWFDPMAYGAKGDGTTDDTAAIRSAIAAIPSTGGTLFIGYPFGMSGTVNVPGNVEVLVTNGGQFIGLSTANLNFNGPVTADAFQIFGGISYLTVRFNVGVTVLPEWWGALANAGNGPSGITPSSVAAAHDDSPCIQAAINSLLAGGTVEFQPKNYAIGTILTVSPIANVMTGWSINLIGAGKNVTNLAVKNAAQGAIKVAGVVSLEQVKYVRVSGFGVYQVVSPGTGGVGVTSYYAQGTVLTDLQVNGFMIGVNLQSSQDTRVERVIVGSTAAVSGFIGFDIDGGLVGTNPYGNNSSTFRDCGVDASGGDVSDSIGYKVFSSTSSGNCADLIFADCATASTAYGWQFNFGNTKQYSETNADIQLINPICDLYRSSGVYITGDTDESMSVAIIGGWFNASSSATTDVFGVAAVLTRGVTITGAQFYPINTSFPHLAYGVMCSGARNVLVSSCLFNGIDRGVYFLANGSTGSDYGSVTGNRFFSNPAGSLGKPMNDGVGVYSSTGVTVNNNVFDAASPSGMTTALYFDSTATKCIGTANVANGANIASNPPIISSSSSSILNNNLW